MKDLKNINSLKSHYRDILKLGIPIVVGQLGIILVGVVDNVMVGRYATPDLATASFVLSIFNISIFFGLGFAYGLTPLVGQTFGRNESDRAGELLKNSILTNFSIGIIMFIAMGALWFYVDKLNPPTELLPLIKGYYLLHLFSLPFIMVFNSFKQFSDGVNDTKTPMYIMLISNLINILGNFIFIYGFAGIPAMGVIGAGISTFAARVFTVIAFLFVFFRTDVYKVYRIAFSKAKISFNTIKRLFDMGIMVALQMGMETALFSISVVMIGWIGKVELAAQQVLTTISTFGFMIYYGLGAALSIKVSNYCGREDYLSMKRVIRAGFHIIICAALVTSTAYYLLKNQVATFFTSDLEVIKTVTGLVGMLILYQFGDALQITYANALRGMSDVKAMALISFVGYFIIALPLSYICGFVFDLGLIGVWVGYPAGLTLTGIMMRLRVASMKRKLK